MEITQHPRGELLELRLNGRIDGTWGDHLSSTIEKAVSAGSHRLELNCSGVNYISSLGIGVIVRHYNVLKSVNGSLVVTYPSKFVRQILDTVGLTSILIDGADAPTAASASIRREVRGDTVYEIHPQVAPEPLSCILIGDPAKLMTTGFGPADCRSLMFPRGTFGLGLGAFGPGFADCKNRFGEFLAAGGCAVALPTGEPDAAPDYLIQEGSLIPRVETLYALSGTGDFSTMVRFDARSEGSERVGMSDLVTTLLDISSASAIAFVILAETVCIVGSSLLKSPALGPLDHTVPGVRDWLSFTTERVSEKSLALLVGVAVRDAFNGTAEFLRPFRPDSTIRAHVHAAVFNYRPVQRGELPFAGTISNVIAASNPKALLHLIADWRAYDGIGETDLARGACWMGPLKTFARG